ncbi:MAG: cysteine desulfurase-like protein [Bacteroidetes bacterium]|nr:cysteine desulfurase-like protein [Bacteroidota bacterium]
MMKKLNTNYVRNHFPAISTGWTFFDNAGGTQVAKQVGDKIVDYLYNINVQLGASYEISQQAETRVSDAQKQWSEAINAKHENEVIFGSSTTALLQNLSRSLVQTFNPGDEVIYTNSDHEANIGPWIEMSKHGIVVKTWNVNPDSLKLELDDLAQIISDKTKLVAFTHVSNVLGTINPVKEITKFIHDRGAKVCVDGVAFAPHRLIDVQFWDVDFYVFSLYKVYGPHYSLLYGKNEILAELPGINHFFIGKEDIHYKLQPGNVNYELTVGCTGILDYFDTLYSSHYKDTSLPLFSRIEKVWELIAQHEEELAEPLINFLKHKNGVRIIGENTSDKAKRVPTISFTVENRKSSEIPLLVDPHKIGIRWGDFYARRLIDNLGLSSNDGVIRVSMVHYNTIEEVNSLILVLDKII